MSKVADFSHAQARRDLTAALQRDGWNIDVLEDPGAGGPNIFLVDAETGYVQLCQPPADGLTQLLARWQRRRGKIWDAVCDALGTLLGELARQTTWSKTDLADAAKLACLYTAGTQIYARLIDAQVPTGTVLVIRFQHANPGEYWLRPAALFRTDVLSPQEVLAAAQDVLALDRVRHPERFPRAPVITRTPRGI